jgi:SAM-dependent methyltransferase
VGLDAVDTLERDDVVEIFDDLVRLFRARARPRNADGFPDYAGAGFPAGAIDDHDLDALLAPQRIAELREQAIAFSNASPECRRLRHIAPWDESDVDCWGEADFVMSHAVLQHVSSPAEVFATLSRLLKPGGYTTHQVSFDSHEITPEWNGHWSCTPWLWKLALGRKAFLVNRVPHSRMLAAAEDNGLEVRADLTSEDHSGITRRDLRPEWSWLEDRDLVTRAGFLVARKR